LQQERRYRSCKIISVIVITFDVQYETKLNFPKSYGIDQEHGKQQATIVT